MKISFRGDWFLIYFLKSIPIFSVKKRHQTREWLSVKQLVLTALLAAIALLFQSAGGLLPGIGYAISPLATAPIVLTFIMSFRSGSMAYCLTILLLLLIQPSEVIVFPFTTGILGAGLGIGFHYFKRRINVILSGTVALFAGIIVLLYLLKFPVLGPAVSSSFNFTFCGIILGFSFLYSWLWMEICLMCLKRIRM